MHAVTRPLLAVAVALPLASCGATVKDTADKPASNSVTSCGVKTTVSTPKASVAYDVSAIEKMFALDLADRMRGIVMPKTVASVAKTSTYAAQYAKTDVIAEDVLSQEQVVGAKSDWVFAGWQAGFSPERGITPDSLKSLGIGSYIQEETCFNYEKSKTKGKAPAADERYALEATYRDLGNLGTIFGVEDKATTLVDGLRKREEALDAQHKNLADKDRPNIFVYDSGTTDPFTSGRRTAPQDIIDLAGGRNIAEDLDARWDVMGWESVTKANPDVILVVDYDKQPLKDKINYLKTQSPIKDSPAVTQNRIRRIDYGEAVSGPRNLDAAEDLAAYLKAEGLL